MLVSTSVLCTRNTRISHKETDLAQETCVSRSTRETDLAQETRISQYTRNIPCTINTCISLHENHRPCTRNTCNSHYTVQTDLARETCVSLTLHEITDRARETRVSHTTPQKQTLREKHVHLSVTSQILHEKYGELKDSLTKMEIMDIARETSVRYMI